MAPVRRNPYMRLLLAFAVIILAGCIPTQSSGVLKLGPDTYTTSAAAVPERGGSIEARKVALTEANEYCAQLGKEILVANIGTATANQYGRGQAEITFRCLAKGDPQLQRPEFRKTPDVTIEDRRK